MKLYIVGDPQVKDEKQFERAKKKRDLILQQANENDCVLIPGDLTSHGIGSFPNNPLTWRVSFCGNTNELQTVKETLLHPLEKKNILIYLCHGNHDDHWALPKCYKPVLDYITNKHGSLRYHKPHKPCSATRGVSIISCGKYPNKDDSSWLNTILSNLDNNEKCIIMFHFNISGPYSDWWSDHEKKVFGKQIKNHKDKILAICIGHHHTSYIREWNGITVINSSGNGLISIDQNGKTYFQNT